MPKGVPYRFEIQLILEYWCALKSKQTITKQTKKGPKHKILKWNLNLKKIIQWSWIQLRLIKKLSSLQYEVIATITMLISKKFKTTVQEQTGNFNRFLCKVAESDDIHYSWPLHRATVRCSDPPWDLKS